jgi:hypothetical protein
MWGFIRSSFDGDTAALRKLSKYSVGGELGTAFLEGGLSNVKITVDESPRDPADFQIASTGLDHTHVTIYVGGVLNAMGLQNGLSAVQNRDLCLAQAVANDVGVATIMQDFLGNQLGAQVRALQGQDLASGTDDKAMDKFANSQILSPIGLPYDH